jgi:SAM-dependent methyltransferase
MVDACRSCGRSGLEHVLHLGNQAPSNALLTQFDQVEKRYPLRLAVCPHCWLLQTEIDVPHTELFNADYPYFSGASQAWREHCYRYMAYATRRFNLRPQSYVVEIGGNDGTLLHYFNCATLNVEPSASVAKYSMAKNIPTIVGRIQDVQLNAGGADLIIANNVMAHDPDLNGFVAAIARGLSPKGTCTIEFPWAVRLLEDGQFDTVYHEHYSYLSITALDPLFERHGLRAYDAEYFPEIHGGTLRLFVGHAAYTVSPFEGGLPRLRGEEAGLRSMRTYEVFRERAFNIAGDFSRFLIENKGDVYGIGAAAKATVFANFCALDYTDIPMIGDATPAKHHKWLPGSRIPIVTEDEVLNALSLWIAAWNWKDSIAFRMREKGFTGKFVVAIPELEVFE